MKFEEMEDGDEGIEDDVSRGGEDGATGVAGSGIGEAPGLGHLTSDTSILLREDEDIFPRP